MRSFIAVLGVLICFSVSTANGQTITTFTTIDDPGKVGTSIWGINNAGVMVGGGNDFNTALNAGVHSFVYSGGAPSNFDLSPTIQSTAMGINDAGQVVGWYQEPRYSYNAYIGTTGGGTTLPVSLGVPGNTVAAAINNAAVIVGYYSTGNSGIAQAGFIDSKGSLSTFAVPGSPVTYLTGINNSGELAGLYQKNGVLYGFATDASGNIQTLNLPGPPSIVRINNLGQVEGYFSNSSGTLSGFVGSPLSPLILNIAGEQSTAITSANDKGQLVGYYVDSAGMVHGFLTSAPPSVLTLAKLSKDVYGIANVQGADGYTPIPGMSVGGSIGNNGFAAAAYQNGTQIVIAVRGTDLSDYNQKVYNLLADASFGNGIPNSIFSADVSQLANLLKSVAAANPDAQITLTGHSLGGALGQIVGDAANIAVTSFDAPGPAPMIPGLGSVLSSLISLNIATPSRQITNYRLYGDQISLVGAQVGSQITVSNGQSAVVSTVLRYNPMAWRQYHDIGNLVNQLAGGASETFGALGPSILNSVVAPIGTHGTNLFYVIDVLNIGAELFLDPGAGSEYLLREGAGSPFLNSIELPFFGDIAGWELAYQNNLGWWGLQLITSQGPFLFGPNVDAVEFFPLDSALDPIFNPDSFQFGLTFDSTGEFQGTVTQFGTSNAVPTPPTLMLVATCFGLMFIFLLRARTASPRRYPNQNDRSCAVKLIGHKESRSCHFAPDVWTAKQFYSTMPSNPYTAPRSAGALTQCPR